MRKKATRELNVFDHHALRIARQTMRYHCAGAYILGGPNHPKAVATILRITGKNIPLPNDCTCTSSSQS